MRSEHPASLAADALEPLRQSGWLRSLWHLGAMALGMAYWACFGCILTLIGLPLHVLVPKSRVQPLGRLALHRLFRWFVGYLKHTGLVEVDSASLQRLAKSGSPLIAAPNHIALWDAVFIMTQLPEAVCVMKKSILRNPLLSGGARLAGFISNQGTTRMIRQATTALEEGGKIVLFPEGTRTQSNARWINPLKGGCAIIALRAQVPIYPIFIRSNTRFLEKGWPLWKLPAFPIHIHLEVGDPLIPAPGDTAHALTARLEHVFEENLSRPHPLRRQIALTPATRVS